MTSDLTGTDPRPLRVLAQGRDANGQYVRAGLTVPRSTAVVIGSDTIPDDHSPSGERSHHIHARHARRGRQARRDVHRRTLEDVTLALRNGIMFGGKSHALTLNPAKDTRAHQHGHRAGLRPAPCVTLRPTTSVEQRHRAPAQGRHGAGAAVGHVRLPLLDQRRRPAG